MKEVEVLVMIQSENFQDIRNKILNVARYVSKNTVFDTYYFDPLRNNLKPDDNLSLYECFRLRKKDDKTYLTYKIDRFDESGKWLYSDENESLVSKPNEISKIISNLGLKELVVVDMIKEYYENEDYTIAIEYVKNLGAFLEIESKKKFESLEEIKEEKQKIKSFIAAFGFDVSCDVGIGKPEMLLKKLAKKQ